MNVSLAHVQSTHHREGDLSDADFKSDDMDDEDGLGDLCQELTLKENGSHSKLTESEVDNEPAFLAQMVPKVNVQPKLY